MSFRDIHGQDRQIDRLQKAYANQRIPHAYCFCGMDGIGKRATALALAQTLNCREGGDDACGTCRSCRKIDHGTHTDLFMIEPRGIVIKIEEIRQLQEQVKYRPFEGTKRVFIIDDADRMNIYAANALLKILEEPGPSNLFILITPRPSLLPRTITSRCQTVRFNPLSREVIAAFLTERLSMDAASALVLASSSQGSIGRAMAMRDDSSLAAKGDLIAGIASYQPGSNRLHLFALAQELGGDRDHILAKMAVLKGWYRDVMILSEGGDHASLIHPDCVDMTARLSEEMTGPVILESIKIIDRACHAIEDNANKQLTLEAMMFKLATIRQTTGINKLSV